MFLPFRHELIEDSAEAAAMRGLKLHAPCKGIKAAILPLDPLLRLGKRLPLAPIFGVAKVDELAKSARRMLVGETPDLCGPPARAIVETGARLEDRHRS